MRLTPLDIQQQKFYTSFRGYDKKEVSSFLELMTNAVSKLNKENSELSDKIRHLQSELEEFHQRERNLKEALITAQKLSEDLLVNAKKEAEMILVEAELQAEKIVQNAQTRVVQIIEDIHEVKRQRMRFSQSLRNIIETHEKLMDLAQEAEGEATKPEQTLQLFPMHKSERSAPLQSLHAEEDDEESQPSEEKKKSVSL